ncbi:MAG: hypothetical protein Q9194_002249 [Teloschistes cf. exilis]
MTRDAVKTHTQLILQSAPGEVDRTGVSKDEWGTHPRILSHHAAIGLLAGVLLPAVKVDEAKSAEDTIQRNHSLPRSRPVWCRIIIGFFLDPPSISPTIRRQLLLENKRILVRVFLHQTALSSLFRSLESCQTYSTTNNTPKPIIDRRWPTLRFSINLPASVLYLDSAPVQPLP